MRTLLLASCTAVFLIFIALKYEMKQQRPIEVSYNTLLPSVQKQVDCLSNNIYYEAAHEGVDGWMGVALVTLNRTKSKQFPSNICKVVTQRDSKVCQFSWLCEKIKPVEKQIYNKIREFAVYTYLNYGSIDDITKGALYYHADYVNPNWNNLTKTAKIGKHIFYKPKGSERYDEQTKLSAKRKWEQSKRQFIYAFDGGYFSPVL